MFGSIRTDLDLRSRPQGLLGIGLRSRMGGVVQTIFGISAEIWWDGFFGAVLGALIGGLVAVAVARITVRGQVALMGAQVAEARAQQRRDRYERAFDGLLDQLPALADRARVYAAPGPRRDEAIKMEKHKNLANDARREVVRRLHLLDDRPIRETVSGVPSAFREFSDRFAQALLLGDEAEASRVSVRDAATLQAYIDEVVELLWQDWSIAGGTHRQVPVPTFT